MLNVEVRVVGDEMNDVPRGEVGEIVYRGPLVMMLTPHRHPGPHRAGIRAGHPTGRFAELVAITELLEATTMR